jgi:hypothetical protein
MCSGKLVHTNEVLLQLGGDMAVHTSAKQAQAVLQRRLAFVTEQAESLSTQIAALQARPAFAPMEDDVDAVCSDAFSSDWPEHC